MKAKWGMFITDGRGKVGGHVASKNRSGSYIRTKVTPTNPQTSFQATVRNRVAAFSQAWRGLTQSVRNSWNEAVDNFQSTNVFGDKFSPSGLNLYVKLNANLDQIGISALTNPPLPATVENIDTITPAAAAGAGTFTVAYTPATVPADTAFIIETTRMVSPGKNFVKNEYRFLTFADAADTSPEDIAAAYVARFGSLVAGQKIGVRVTPINKTTGQKGVGLSELIIVAA